MEGPFRERFGAGRDVWGLTSVVTGVAEIGCTGYSDGDGRVSGVTTKTTG